MYDYFDRFARKAAKTIGSPLVFTGAVVLIGLWAAMGPILGFSDTWQLLANTTTTLATTLIVLLIQHTQNEDTAAMKALLRELADDIPGVSRERAERRAREEK